MPARQRSKADNGNSQGRAGRVAGQSWRVGPDGAGGSGRAKLEGLARQSWRVGPGRAGGSSRAELEGLEDR
ncbi:hypothetical protein B5E60_07255 [Alistipes sp. An116]|nr:hypothetical protein B5E60_07255 [Alistipes sp. An116]